MPQTITESWCSHPPDIRRDCGYNTPKHLIRYKSEPKLQPLSCSHISCVQPAAFWSVLKPCGGRTYQPIGNLIYSLSSSTSFYIYLYTHKLLFNIYIFQLAVLMLKQTTMATKKDKKGSLTESFLINGFSFWLYRFTLWIYHSAPRLSSWQAVPRWRCLERVSTRPLCTHKDTFRLPHFFQYWPWPIACDGGAGSDRQPHLLPNVQQQLGCREGRLWGRRKRWLQQFTDWYSCAEPPGDFT